MYVCMEGERERERCIIDATYLEIWCHIINHSPCIFRCKVLLIQCDATIIWNANFELNTTSGYHIHIKMLDMTLQASNISGIILFLKPWRIDPLHKVSMHSGTWPPLRTSISSKSTMAGGGAGFASGVASCASLRPPSPPRASLPSPAVRWPQRRWAPPARHKWSG